MLGGVISKHPRVQVVAKAIPATVVIFIVQQMLAVLRKHLHLSLMLVRLQFFHRVKNLPAVAIRP
jgi:hypothetical protein